MCFLVHGPGTCKSESDVEMVQNIASDGVPLHMPSTTGDLSEIILGGIELFEPTFLSLIILKNLSDVGINNGINDVHLLKSLRLGQQLVLFVDFRAINLQLEMLWRTTRRMLQKLP